MANKTRPKRGRFSDSLNDVGECLRIAIKQKAISGSHIDLEILVDLLKNMGRLYDFRFFVDEAVEEHYRETQG